MKSRLSLSASAPQINADLRTAVAEARLLRLTGLELPLVSTQLDLLSLSGSGRREVVHLMGSHGIVLSGIRIELGGAGLGPRTDVDRLLDRLEKVLNVAAGMHCPVVNIDLGRLPPVQRTSAPKPAVTPDMAGLLILPAAAPQEPEPESTPTKIDPAVTAHWQQALSQLGEMADRYGAMIGFSSSLSSFASLVSLLRSVQCLWFGVELDTAAVLRDEWTMEAVFDELAPMIRSVRARDAVVGDDRRTKPAIIGRGDLPWRTLLEHLDASDYTGAFTLDAGELTDPKAGVIAGIKQINAIIAS
jgi:sugar phosphate isomerase/epimerase